MYLSKIGQIVTLNAYDELIDKLVLLLLCRCTDYTLYISTYKT